MRIVDVSMSHGGRDECGMPTVSGPQAWVAVVSDAYRCLRDLFTLQSVASWQSLTHSLQTRFTGSRINNNNNIGYFIHNKMYFHRLT